MSRLSCVGVSPHLQDREAAREAASVAALEEMANAVALKIESPSFDEAVRSKYSEARRRAMLAFDAIRGDRKSAAYRDAYATVFSARRRAAQAFQDSGGEAAPVSQADWYWELLEPEKGVPSAKAEFRVFVLYTANSDEVRRLVEAYTTPVTVGDSQVISAFPLLAWSYPDFVGGVEVLAAGSELSDQGLEPGAVIGQVDGADVHSAEEFASAMAKHSADAGAVQTLTYQKGELHDSSVSTEGAPTGEAAQPSSNMPSTQAPGDVPEAAKP